MHNTLAASDYGLIDEESLEPRPDYWAALLWKRLMGSTVLEAGASPASGLYLYAHCLAGRPGGVALLALNTDRTAARDLTIAFGSERFTLTAAQGLLANSVELNGKGLALGKAGALPPVQGARTLAGLVSLPAASITFLALPNAGNAACR
jgi:heparanase